jgi:hypothetical protein
VKRFKGGNLAPKALNVAPSVKDVLKKLKIGINLCNII